jgi:hypothetical protein
MSTDQTEMNVDERCSKKEWIGAKARKLKKMNVEMIDWCIVFSLPILAI